MLKNEKGSITPSTVVFILVLAIMVSGIGSVFLRMSVASEDLQAVADTAASAALVQGLKDAHFRHEVIDYDDELIKNTFVGIIRDHFDMHGSSPFLHGEGRVKEIKVEEFGVYNYTDYGGKGSQNWGFIDNKKRNFILLEAILVAKIEVESMWDTSEERVLEYREYGTDIPRTFTIEDSSGEGMAEIPVRTVARLVVGEAT